MLNEERLQHIENGHSEDLVAADDVNDDEEVSYNDEPYGAVEGDEDVVLDGVAEYPVAD